MRKLLTTLLITMMIFALCACANQPATPEDTTTTQTQADTTAPATEAVTTPESTTEVAITEPTTAEDADSNNSVVLEVPEYDPFAE